MQFWADLSVMDRCGSYVGVLSIVAYRWPVSWCRNSDSCSTLVSLLKIVKRTRHQKENNIHRFYLPAEIVSNTYF